jgi:hypothetical protein
MFILDPDFFPIPDTKTSKEGDENKYSQTLFCSHKFHKIEKLFFFEMLKKIFLPLFKEL